MRRALLSVLLALGAFVAVAPAASADEPLYDPFCVENEPPAGPMVTVCTPG